MIPGYSVSLFDGMHWTFPTSDAGRTAAALLFMQAGMVVFDTYSTLNSSPWTAENVGADPDKFASLQEYVMHAAIYSTAYCVGAAVIGNSAFPLYGAVINNCYLYWIYNRAATRAKQEQTRIPTMFGQTGGPS
jgi:hypothetical protein